MKKFIWVLVLCLLGVCWAVTEVHTQGTGAAQRTYPKLMKASVTFTAVELDAEVIETLNSIHGVVLRIVIDVTGTDEDYTVLLRDESDITIFTKANLDSYPSADFSYAIYENDSEGNPWLGIPVSGTIDLVVTDAEELALSAMTVHIYYIGYWI